MNQPKFSKLVDKPSIKSSIITSISNTVSEDILYDDFNTIKCRIPINGYGEMCEFVCNNITSLLTSAISKSPKALQLVTDKEFLIAMDISNISLNKEYTNRFNRVYRSYVIHPEKNVIYNQDCANLLYNIAVRLNKKMVDILYGIGLPYETALWLTVNRFSSTDERMNIRRMVREMQHAEPSIMTEQMVVNIFAKTFNDQLTNLFITIMTDKFDKFYSEDEKYIYSTVSNAILDILNTMDEEEIIDIINEYESELKVMGVSGRFSLKNVNSGDYKNIANTVKYLESIGCEID